MTIFKTPSHAKGVTKTLLDLVKSNPKTKLSEFRQKLADETGFNSFNDILNAIEKAVSKEVEEISIVDLIKQGTFAIQVNNESFGSFMFDEHILSVYYETSVNKHGIAQDEVRVDIPLVNIPKGVVNGDTVTFIDDCDEEVTLKIFLPVSENGIKITTEVSLITVSNGKGDEMAFLNGLDTEIYAFNAFDFYASECLSNYDEYSTQDLKDAFANGELFYGSGTIRVE